MSEWLPSLGSYAKQGWFLVTGQQAAARQEAIRHIRRVKAKHIRKMHALDARFERLRELKRGD